MSRKCWIKSIFSKFHRRCVRALSGSSPIMGRSVIKINSAFLILLCGDIETNPGPDMENNPNPSSNKPTGKEKNRSLQDERHEAVMEYLRSLQTGQKEMMERQDLMIVRLKNIEKDVVNIKAETSEIKKEQDAIKDEVKELFNGIEANNYHGRELEFVMDRI